MPDVSRCFALVPCAGVGARAGTAGAKQYAALAGRAVVAHTLAALAAVPQLHATLVVLAPDDTQFESHVAGFDAAWVARCGGASRAVSVAAGLAALRKRGAADADWVLVHDAARCLLRPAWVQRLIDACIGDGVGGLLAVPLADTLKQARPRIDKTGRSDEADRDTIDRSDHTLDRSAKWLAQTPQMFRLGMLQQALQQALQHPSAAVVTDEAGAIEAMGHAPLLVPGDVENIKLTWPADFALAERLLATLPAEMRGGRNPWI